MVNQSKKSALGWALFDFGNSAYSLLIVTFVFPIFYKQTIWRGAASADFYWGLITSGSVIIAGILAPYIGAQADHDGKRKKRFVLWTLLSIIFTALLFFTYPGTTLRASTIFLLANLSFTLAVFLNDALLIHVADTNKRGKISGLGYGLGYLGGLIALIALRPLYTHTSGISLLTTRLTFVLVALYFLIFSLPAFFFIKDKEITPKPVSIRHTYRELLKHPNILYFLIGFFLLNDALVTVFAFISIYATNTLGLSIATLTNIYILIQVIAIPATIFLGTISDKIHPKKIVLGSIVLWIAVIILLTFAQNTFMFVIASICAGMGIGSSQAVARAWYSSLIPPDKSTAFFGFNACCSKIAAILGPVMFGLIATISGSQRIAMGSLVIWFILSMLLFIQVKTNYSYIQSHRSSELN